MKKAVLALALTLLLAITLPAAAVDYKFISDLSQHKNKYLNILTPDAKQYAAQGYTVQGEDDIDGYQTYYLSLIGSDGQKIETFPDEVTLYFRLPRKVNRDSLAYYDLTITQTNGQEVKTYSTADGTVFLHTQYGVGIKTDRLGDFRIDVAVADNIGPTWDELMEGLAETPKNGSFECDGIRVSRQEKKVTIQGLRDDSRIRSDIDDLAIGLMESSDCHFVFDRVELQEILISPQEMNKWTVHFTDSVKICGGVEVWLQPSSSVELINDTEIRDRDEYLSQRDYPLVVEVPQGSSFKLKGKGSIPVDYCIWRTSTMEEVYLEQKSALINVFVHSDSTQEAIPKFAKVFNDIHLDHKQFPTKELSASIRTCLVNTESDEDNYEVLYEDHPAASSLSELNAGRVNLLMPGEKGKIDLLLKVAIHEQSGDQAIAYEIALVDNETKATADISEGADLYLPYPSGMDMESAAKYQFVITHYTAFGEESFSTDDASIVLTPYGLRIRIHSMSPFLMTWEEAAENLEIVEDTLPKTGDVSHIGVYLALLVLASAGVAWMKRRAA